MKTLLSDDTFPDYTNFCINRDKGSLRFSKKSILPSFPCLLNENGLLGDPEAAVGGGLARQPPASARQVPHGVGAVRPAQTLLGKPRAADFFFRLIYSLLLIFTLIFFLISLVGLFYVAHLRQLGKSKL